jgi:AcrR family transcriptional regulator
MICSSANLDLMTETTAPLSGRRAQAARNDEVILKSARAVFIADPGAPISAVAEHAGVGISALYRRYPSKEELLRKLCTDGLTQYIEEAEAALADDSEPWQAFSRFMHRLVEIGSSSLTRRLAGTFTPTPELYEAAQHAQDLNVKVFDRVAGQLRKGVVVDDLGLLLEQVTSLQVGDPERSNQLQHRYLAIALDGLRAGDGDLPGPPPDWAEMAARWSGPQSGPKS